MSITATEVKVPTKPVSIAVPQHADASRARVRTGAFVPNEVFELLDRFTSREAEACDFGVVQLDDTGRVLLCNTALGQELDGVRIDEAVGMNFFTELVPCANNPLLYGRFRQGVAAGRLNVCLPYTFSYTVAPTNARVHMYRDAASGTNWVFVARA